MTAGATEAIAATVLALCDPGDEILAFEPTYDSYTAVAAMAGARLRPVTLRPPGYEADVDALAALVTDRTRLLLLNTPHNPTGKVFTVAELEAIARLCVEHDLIAVTDEVYEHLVFDGEHRPLATFPGMAERTLTISSAGKTFSFTGWKIGWVCGPEELVTAVRTAKQFLTYVNGAPFQPADRGGPRAGRRLLRRSCATTLQAKRDVLCDGLRAAGFDVFVPQGTYFATVDIRSVGGDDGLDVLPRAARALRRGRGAELGLLRGPGHRSAPRPVRVLQAHRGPHRGGRAARGAQGELTRRSDRRGLGASTRPSRQAVRCDHAIVSAMAENMIAQPESCLASTNVCIGSHSSRTSVIVAIARCAPAHRIVSPRKSEVMLGFWCISGVTGQKSSARRPISGRPPMRDAKNTPPVTSVPRIGCAKYTKLLPLATAMVVRIVMPMTLSTSTWDTGWRCTSRRANEP